MQTTKRVVSLMVAAMFGCTQADDRGVTAPESAPMLAASGAQQRVTGHANVRLPFTGNPTQRYSANAIRHADGSVSGQFQLRTEQVDGGSIHGSVLCFTIVGNRARLGGVIERSSTPLATEGQHVIWNVVDNGEGRRAPPDETSDFFPVPAAVMAAHCATGFNLGSLPVLGGNIQVHP